MTTVRLSAELEGELAKAAEMLGETTSDFIRTAIRERLNRLAVSSARDELHSMIGAVRTATGSNARHSGKAFKDVLAAPKRKSA